MADYTVQAGDTLNKIAAANGTTVKALCEANGIENPDLILVGQELSLGKVSETPKEEAAVPVDAKPEDLETEQAKMQAEAQVIQAEVEEGTFETLGKKLDTGIDNTIEFAEEKWEQGKKIAKESYEYVADKVNGAIETVKETYDDTKKYVAEKVDGAIETVKETYNETKEYVAEKLDLCSRYVSDLERDKSLGGISTLVKLCNLYQVTPTIILKEYLDLSEDIKIDPELSGYYSLSSDKKQIILKLIEFLNKDNN